MSLPNALLGPARDRTEPPQSCKHHRYRPVLQRDPNGVGLCGPCWREYLRDELESIRTAFVG